MKKIKLLMILFASALGITAEAAVAVSLYPAITDSITWNSASLTTEVAGNVGSYQHYYRYQPAGDTVHTTSNVSYNGATLQRILSGLPANTVVQVRSVIINQGDTVVSNTISFTTKPAPHTAWLSAPVTSSGPSVTTVSVSYNVSLPTRIFVKYNSYLYSSDTVVVNGVGTATLSLTSPNVPGANYSGNVIWAKPLQTGIVPDTFIQLLAFTVPNWTLPTVGPITFSNVSQDTFRVTCQVTKGNAGSVVITRQDLDSNGNVVATFPGITAYRDTGVVWTRSSCVPFGLYGEKVTVQTAGGSATSTNYQRTLEVNKPLVVGFDTFDLEKTSVSIKVTVATKGKPSWYSSTSSVWLKYQDKFSNWITTTKQVVSGSTTNSIVLFTGLTDLIQNPGSNTVKGYIQNGAGLIDSQTFVFKLKPLDAAIPISSGWYIDAISAYEIGLKNINAGPGSFNLYALRRIVGSGQVDTLLLRPNQVGYTSFPQRDTLGGCIGSTWYEVRLAAKNLDDVWSVTSPQQIQTITAADPTFFISNQYQATQTSIVSKISGCGNGTRVYLEVQVFSLSNLLSPIATHSYGYLGTGNFSVFDSVYSLNPCTRYLVRALVHNGQYANQLTEERQMETKCDPTGIETTRSPWIVLFPNLVTDVVSLESSDAIGEIVIFSATTGQEMYCDTFTGMHADIQVSNLPKGNYVIQGIGFKKRFSKE